MNPDESPFLKWPGLDLDDPDYFELLGIGPEETDDVQIKRAAKDALHRLGNQPASPDELASWKKVRRHIKNAYHCLSDHKSRALYMAQLLAEAKESRQAEPDEDDSQVTSTNLETVSDELQTEFAHPDHAADTSNDEIPVALPIAEVVEDESIDGGKPAEHQVRFEAPIVDAGKKTGRRRKKSILPFTLLVAVACGGGYAAYDYFIKSRSRDNAKMENDDQVTDPLPAGITRTQGERQSRKEKDGQVTPKKRTNSSPSKGDTFPSKKRRTRQKEPPADKDKKAENKNEDALTEIVSPAKEARPFIDTSWADLSPSEAPNQFGFYHHLEEAAYAMRRREWDSMFDQFDAAKYYTRDQNMLEIWYRQRVVADAYRGFWFRVARKAAKLEAMTEIQLEDQPVIITEAKKDVLVYRLAGQRIENRYEQLPTLVALAIMERKMREDSSDVLKDRVTVYCVAGRFNPVYQQAADAHLAAAEAAGLWVDDFRGFQAEKLDEVYQPRKIKQILPRQIRGRRLLRKYRDQEKLLQGVENLSQDQFRIRIGQIRDAALQSTDEQNEKATVFLQYAIDQCVERFEPDLLTELLNVKKRRTRAGGHHPTYLKHFEQMAKPGMDDEAARRLLVHVLEFHKRMKKSQTEPQTARSLQLARSIARKHEFADELERIERIYGDNSPRNAGRLGI